MVTYRSQFQNRDSSGVYSSDSQKNIEAVALLSGQKYRPNGESAIDWLKPVMHLRQPFVDSDSEMYCIRW